ncbi:unnamed protein product [Hymenolepis diminuta]|uniref:Uncharacterized protein n=1 Tax=Hymenolepis diminuta TaxID=6216 RepID=A0A564YSF1_HYMDI|nr:unnamed protein product [Hymenolepis diminuta]
MRVNGFLEIFIWRSEACDDLKQNLIKFKILIKADNGRCVIWQKVTITIRLYARFGIIWRTYMNHFLN